ncbi:MAG: LPS-assembly lipoprotein LptE [Gammaproteobacteria bacterium]
MTMRLILIMLAVGGLSACGDWHLRGTRTDLVNLKSVAINGRAAPVLQQALLRELAYSNVRVVARADSEAVLELGREEFDRRVVSVDPDTGKVRELELTLEVGFAVRDKDGNLLAPYQNLNWLRDFVFDETALLGTNEQESVIRRELAEDAAKTIVLRLETIDPSESKL